MIAWLAITLRGISMGIADIIPGVSGGTLALILGIYERFVGAVSAIGPGMIRALFGAELWRRLGKGLRTPGAEGGDPIGTYASHILFLGFLVVGIGAAMAVGARFIPTLLSLYPAAMKAFFFGLVLASVLIPWRLMRSHEAVHAVVFVLLLAGTWVVTALPASSAEKARGSVRLTLPAPAPEELRLSAEGTVFMTARHGEGAEKREVAFAPLSDLVVPAGTKEVEIDVLARMAGVAANVEAGALTEAHGVPEGATIEQHSGMAGGADPPLWFIFLAGCIAISAMVLPGISGSFMLLMMGLYHYITFTLRAALYDRDPEAMAVIAIFLGALVVGIATFSRLLKWLFEHFHDATMAGLVGLMLGSLRKLWPFVATGAEGTTENILPTTLDATTLVALGTFVVGVVLVLALEKAGRRTLETAA